MTLEEVFKHSGIAILKVGKNKSAIRYIDGSLFILVDRGQGAPVITELKPQSAARYNNRTEWQALKPGSQYLLAMSTFLRKRADIANANKGPGLIDSIRAADQVRGIRGLLHDMKLASLAQEEIYQYAKKIRRSSINIELSEQLTNLITVATRLKESL